MWRSIGKDVHHHVGAGLGLVEQGAHQGRDAADRRVGLAADPEAEVGRNLIVARAGGVKTASGLADQRLEAALDVHMDVLERPRVGELPGLDL
jgi:hypothetical protein